MYYSADILCQGCNHAFPKPSVNLRTHISNTINIKYASLLSYRTIKHLHVEYLQKVQEVLSRSFTAQKTVDGRQLKHFQNLNCHETQLAESLVHKMSN